MNILIAIPARNEAMVLQKNILKLHDFCATHFTSDEWHIVIADSASTDDTANIAKQLTETHRHIQYITLTEAGKGRAIRAAWTTNPTADAYVFMDADLASDLHSLPPLVYGVTKEGYDVAIGSRALPHSVTERSFFRFLISKGYAFISRLFFHTRIADLPCGFKAINGTVFKEILPLVQNNEWFFDSELTLIAEHRSKKILEIPVVWKDARERPTRVPILHVIMNYLTEMYHLRKRLRQK